MKIPDNFVVLEDCNFTEIFELKTINQIESLLC
jgi:hypothetical protein